MAISSGSKSLISGRRVFIALGLALAAGLLLWRAFSFRRVESESISPTPHPAAQIIRDAAERVPAVMETEPVPHAGDAADDSAIWVNPSDPSRSAIIGTDKKGGLAVYALNGAQIQYLPEGEFNNVDLRDGFPLGGLPVSLVTAGNRTQNSIAVYSMDPATRQLQPVAARTILPGIRVYGSCMYHDPAAGKVYVYVSSGAGRVEQWELFDNGRGRVDGRRVRSFEVGAKTEGCVADDGLGAFYISAEAVGIWRYGAGPDADTERTLVDRAVPQGNLVPDIEGLAIASTGDGTGYLIASSQGSDTFAMYRREGDNEFVKSFTIVDGDGIDGVSHTDGIEVTTQPLGPAFPHGLFVAQDGQNDTGNQNFKLIPWPVIAPAASRSDLRVPRIRRIFSAGFARIG